MLKRERAINRALLVLGICFLVSVAISVFLAAYWRMVELWIYPDSVYFYPHNVHYWGMSGLAGPHSAVVYRFYIFLNSGLWRKLTVWVVTVPLIIVLLLKDIYFRDRASEPSVTDEVNPTSTHQ